jgi:peptidoglycan-N-acetylglucosamine deacetylase
MLLACIAAPAASAADCPDHPDAIGTSRTLVVDPREHPRIGVMQYPETLPLADHEVVLTFDDGPLPRNSNQILDILAAQCVKATFFEIGRMAQAYPEGVRKLAAAGHSIGTHTEDHPLTMNHMPIERARQEIDDGIASVKAALGDDAAALGPFFRIPGLLREEAVEDYMASMGIQIWSADFLADDWRHISSARVFELAIKRLEQRGKGILLLHDIQSRTVAALPRILQEMKARGYRIVHVVAATPENPATPTEPEDWRLHPEDMAAHWPKILPVADTDAGTLPAPSLWDKDWLDDGSITLAPGGDNSGTGHGVPVPREAPWPRQSPLPVQTAIALPVPAQGIFDIPEGLRMAMRTGTPAAHREEQAAAVHEAAAIEAVESRAATHGRHRAGQLRHVAGRGSRHIAGRASRHVAHARHVPLKHLVQVKRRSV